MILIERSPTSYELRGSPPELANYLIAHGYRELPMRSDAEAYRLRHPHGGIVIIYHSQSVILQGDMGSALSHIQPLIVQSPDQAMLPW